jgi:hypothetical protein
MDPRVREGGKSREGGKKHGKTVKAQGRQAKTSLYFPLIHAPIAATTFGSSPI